MAFDHSSLFRPDMPAPAARWPGFAEFNFVGGDNDPDSTPVAGLAAAADAVLNREGRTLATYGLDSGPQGYRALREHIASHLRSSAGMSCGADDIVVTSGSLQAIELVNAVYLERGDTVIVEDPTFGGALTRLQRLGVNYVGVGVDRDGMRTDQLAAALADLAAQSTQPKYIYTVPTVQNPTGTIMSKARRLELLDLAAQYEVAIFEDDCYADLTWDGVRPPAVHALDSGGRVVYCGSFSKSVAPALRVGYLVADWPVLSQILPLKTDAGSGALEQLVLGEYAAAQFDTHIADLRRALKAKCDAMVAALEEQFGAAAEFRVPAGGIVVWVNLPPAVDTSRLAEVARAEGVAIDPGAAWTADPATGRHSMRLCFAYPSLAAIGDGIARLAEICHRETGIPVHGANVRRRSR